MGLKSYGMVVNSLCEAILNLNVFLVVFCQRNLRRSAILSSRWVIWERRKTGCSQDGPRTTEWAAVCRVSDKSII